MVKKMAIFSLAVVLMFAMAGIAAAKPSVANTSQKGSLLVFPKIIATDNATSGFIGPQVDTYISIGNDNTVGTWVKCYWMDNNQTVQDFFFYLTPNQPVIFSAWDGGDLNFPIPPFRGIGTLACWAAKDDDTVPIKFNHLYGTAMIRYGDTATVTPGKTIWYPAYSFAAEKDLPNFPAPVPAGSLYEVLADGALMLRLTGDGPTVINQRGYDACPLYLVFNFIPENGTLAPLPLRPDLTLWPCRQDLRQDRTPTCTKAKYDIWNENEVKFTGTYQCLKCFWEGFLSDIGEYNRLGKPAVGSDNALKRKKFMEDRGPGYGGTKFTDAVLRTASARARVQGIYSTVCVGSTNTATGASTTKTRVIGGIGCPNVVDGISFTNANGTPRQGFRDAWGESASAITPLLGVMMYAQPDTIGDSLTAILPQGAYTLIGAGAANWNGNGTFNQNGGWVKYDPGTGAAEVVGR